MSTKEIIRTTLGMSDRVLSGYLADLNDADLLVRPVPGQNHIAWQLGHLLVSERGMLESIKPGSSPALPEGFEAAHGREEDSTRSDDPGRFCTKEEYLRLLAEQRAATAAVLDALTDDEIDRPAPERLQRMVPTVGGVLNLVGMHILMHVGQFVSVRRKLAKPVAI